VVKYEALEQFMDIIGDDATWSDLSNIAVNDTDRWDQSFLPGLNKELMHGSVTQRYIRENNIKFKVYLVIPLVIYLDETHVTGNGRIGLQPVIMAVGLLSKKARYQKRNTRCLGYVPRYDKRSKAQKQHENTLVSGRGGRGCRNFHRCFSVILDAVQQMRETLLLTPKYVRLGDEVRKVVCHMFVAFFCEDAKSQDMLTGRYAAYNCSRLSRACDISFQNANIAGFLCGSFSQAPIQDAVKILANPDSGTAEKTIAKDRLLASSNHRCHNSLRGVNTGGQVLLPLPHDMMHIFATICETLFELITCCLSPKERAQLDLLSNEIFLYPRSGERGRFPRTFFSRGYTNVSGLTCDDWIGVLLSSLILANLPRGMAAINEATTRSKAREASVTATVTATEEELPPLVEISASDMIDLFEDLLEDQALDIQGYPYEWSTSAPKEDCIFTWNENQCRLLRRQISAIQTKIRARYPRRKGNGWRTQKFHEMLHIPSDVQKYGLPWNFDSGWGESLLRAKPQNSTPELQFRVLI
jgi:hypothetical protein